MTPEFYPENDEGMIEGQIGRLCGASGLSF